MPIHYGIQVYQPSAIAGKSPRVIFTTQHPFAKLDTQKEVSFQNIVLTLQREPPNPNGTSIFTLDTIVYQFAHGYTYLPTPWMIYQLLNAPEGSIPNLGTPSQYQYYGGLIATSANEINKTYIFLEVDDKNVYLYIQKFYNASAGVPAVVAGMVINIRIYIFVESLLTNTL